MLPITPKIEAMMPTVRRLTALALFNTGQRMRILYKLTVSTWKKKPKFEIKVTQTKQFFSVVTGTDDEIYGYVDKGTRPHFIRPKKKFGRLFFRKGFQAKTFPGVIASGSGGSFGKMVVAREVRHPGIKARKFTPTIMRQTKGRFLKLMNQAFKQTAEFINKRSQN
jgi:hypothetical protein